MWSEITRRLPAIVAAAMLTACSGSVEVATPSTDDPVEPTTVPTSASTSAPATTEESTATTTSEATTTTIDADALTLPTDPSGLAEALSVAERTIRDPSVADDDATAWGRRLQRLYRLLSTERSWADQILAEVDPAVADDVSDNWAARRRLSSLVNSTTLSATLPAWRIDEPEPVGDLLAAYDAAEAATGVPWSVLASIHLVETRMGRIEGLSTAGAVGPMQFLPSTWEACCEGDPTVDADAIMGAAVLLRSSGALDDLAGAVFAYNHSDDYAEAILAYARVLDRDRLAYRGYHAFEVYFLSASGLVLLEPGYFEPEPVDAAEWIAQHPDALLS